MDLSANNLSGPIPSELGNLTALEELDLGPNDLSGPIPSELGNLTALRYLYLYGNALSGPIPPWLGNLTVGVRPSSRHLEWFPAISVRWNQMLSIGKNGRSCSPSLT